MGKDTDKPIDRGWAWVEVLGAATCNFFVVGAFKSLGILFVEFRSIFGASSALTALMMGVTSGGMSLLAPAANNLANRYSSRVCVMLGGVLLAIATFISAFAPNIYYVIVVFGVFTGVSYSFLYGPSLMMVGFYFEKRRSTANGMAVAGSSIGQLVIPLLITYLLREYTLKGTLIIYSAFALHTIAAGALLTPLSFYDRDERRRKREIKARKSDQNSSDVVSNGKSHHQEPASESAANAGSSDLVLETGSGDPVKHNDLNKTEENVVASPVSDDHCLLDNGDNVLHDKNLGMVLKKIDDHYTSQNSLYLAPHQTVPEECVKLEQKLKADKGAVTDTHTTTKSSNCFVRFFKGVWNLYEWSLLKQSLFVIYVITICLGNCGYVNIFLFVPPHAKDIGIAEDKAAMLLSIAGISDLFGRVLGGFFADLGYIKRSTFMACTILFTGVAAIISTFFTTFVSMVALCLVMGLVGGFYISMMAVVLVDFVGLEKFPSALGLTIMFMGFTNCGTPTMLGMIRDQTGSYLGSFWVCGCMMLVAGAAILFEPIARRFDNRHQKPPTDKPACNQEA